MADETQFVGDDDHGNRPLTPQEEAERCRSDPLHALRMALASCGEAQVHPELAGVIEAAAAEIGELRMRLFNIRLGFEGCCHACEPVGHLNMSLSKRVGQMSSELSSMKLRIAALEGELAAAARLQTDESRRLFCETRASAGMKVDHHGTAATPQQIAQMCGWDCYRDQN